MYFSGKHIYKNANVPISEILNCFDESNYMDLSKIHLLFKILHFEFLFNIFSIVAEIFYTRNDYLRIA